MRKTSLADVAKSLGVSKTLVSLVLNGRGNEKGISKDTQKRVWERVKEMNYKPNQMARGLRMGKSNTIGLLVADIANPFYAKICRSIEDHAAQHGYNLIICSSDENPEKESELLQMLIDRQVDGLIFSTTQAKTDDILQFKRSKFPFVLIDRCLPRIETNYVGVDNRKGAHEVVEHLLELGNRRIGCLAISPSHLSTIKDRIAGYKDALKAHQIRFDGKLVREIPFEDIKQSVRKEIKELLMPPHNVTALFVVNNNVAVACLEALQEMNIKVPQDLALVSFDDIELFKLCYPPVTAVAQPIEEIGSNAMALLLENIKAGKAWENKQVNLGTEVVVRRSCGSFINQL
jgi:LacI family transcriptional regulator